MAREGREITEYLGEELGGPLANPAEGAGEGSTDGSTRKEIVSGLESLMGEAAH